MLPILENILLDLSSTKEIDSGDLDIAGRNILLACCNGLNITRASMWRVCDEGMYCDLLIEKGQKQNVDNMLLTRTKFPAYFQALSKERVIIANDAHTYRATHEFSKVYLEPLNIQSMLDIPIRHKGKMIGIICAEYQGENCKKWTPDEVVFGCTLAELFGRALSSSEKVAYERELEHINANLEKIIEDRTVELEQTITDLHSTQAHLVESEKMAALGGLVAGVAHEINTPIGVSVTAASHFSLKLKTCREKYQNNELTHEDFEKLLNSAEKSSSLVMSNLERASNLIRSFKRIAVDQTHDDPREIMMFEYMDEIISSLTPNLKRLDPTIAIECDSNLAVFTHPGAISQIITNLVINSLHHGFDEPLGRKETIRLNITQENNYIHITYQDNGKGIAKDKCAKIFDPFYTTKRNEGGSGLGMHIVYNLVSQTLGGRIQLNSDTNQGVKFKITFPVK